MRIKCSRNELNDIVNTVQKAVSPKSALPILECIKIDADATGLATFMANNTDICIVYKKALNIPEGGTIALTSKMFGDIVRKLPDNEVDLYVNEENNVTKITCGESVFNILGLLPNEFPNPPEIEEKYSFYITHQKLKNIIKKTISFVSLSEGKRPTLTGALFDIKNDRLSVVTSDGHRLGVVREELNQNIGDNKFIIPGSSLREIFKILKDDESQIKVIISDRHVLFEFGEFLFYSRLLDGEFIKYESFISIANPINIKISVNEMKQSLERALLLINEDAGGTENKVPVRLNISSNKIEFSSMTNKGKVNDVIGADVIGDDLVIGFNCRFLLDALNSCEEEVVKLEMSSPSGGCFVKPVNDDDDSYVFMILPVRIYN